MPTSGQLPLHIYHKKHRITKEGTCGEARQRDNHKPVRAKIIVQTYKNSCAPLIPAAVSEDSEVTGKHELRQFTQTLTKQQSVKTSWRKLKPEVTTASVSLNLHEDKSVKETPINNVNGYLLEPGTAVNLTKLLKVKSCSLKIPPPMERDMRLKGTNSRKLGELKNSQEMATFSTVNLLQQSETFGGIRVTSAMPGRKHVTHSPKPLSAELGSGRAQTINSPRPVLHSNLQTSNSFLIKPVQLQENKQKMIDSGNSEKFVSFVSQPYWDYGNDDEDAISLVYRENYPSPRESINEKDDTTEKDEDDEINDEVENIFERPVIHITHKVKKSEKKSVKFEVPNAEDLSLKSLSDTESDTPQQPQQQPQQQSQEKLQQQQQQPQQQSPQQPQQQTQQPQQQPQQPQEKSQQQPTQQQQQPHDKSQQQPHEKPQQQQEKPQQQPLQQQQQPHDKSQQQPQQQPKQWPQQQQGQQHQQQQQQPQPEPQPALPGQIVRSPRHKSTLKLRTVLFSDFRPSKELRSPGTHGSENFMVRGVTPSRVEYKFEETFPLKTYRSASSGGTIQKTTSQTVSDKLTSPLPSRKVLVSRFAQNRGYSTVVPSTEKEDLTVRASTLAPSINYMKHFEFRLNEEETKENETLTDGHVSSHGDHLLPAKMCKIFLHQRNKQTLSCDTPPSTPQSPKHTPGFVNWNKNEQQVSHATRPSKPTIKSSAKSPMDSECEGKTKQAQIHTQVHNTGHVANKKQKRNSKKSLGLKTTELVSSSELRYVKVLN